jgi:hypothetical protein
MAKADRMLHKKDNKANGLRAAYSATGAISLPPLQLKSPPEI